MPIDERGLRLIPLGGLGEFGLNSLVLEWEGHRLLLDAGVLFPNAETPGVDSIVPDFERLRDPGAKLEAILLTHGHEDHVGALAYALQAAPAPVYGTRLTLGLARGRLRERGVEADVRVMAPGQPFEAGPFRIHPIAVAHSVLDSVALAIETPAGVVLASGDFKLDEHGPPGERTDRDALAAWGERGVLVLLSDSTNVECKGRTPGEDDVIPAFEEIFERTPGRVVVSCFATSIPRIQRVADLACQRGRAVAFVGRRMVDNTETALDLGLLRISGAHRVDAHSLNSLPPDKVTAFVSGSQGEPLSALSMVGLGEHRDLSVGPGDTVVFSARVIPGNERTVSRAIGRFYRRGCDVVHPGTARVHVSGHGSRDDLAELIRLTRPRYLIPVHGEYRMLAQHARLAAETGVPADQVLLVDDGDVLAFGPWGVRREERAAAGRVLLDGASNGAVEDVVVRDRRHLSADGIVVPVVVVDKATGRVEHAPEIVSRGFASERSDVLEEASRLLVSAIEARPPEELADPALTRERVRQELRRFFKRRMGRRPMVIPVVMEV